MYLFCVFVCLCAVYHKDVPSFGGACHVKMTHLLAGFAHMCFCYMFKRVCVCQCGTDSKDFHLSWCVRCEVDPFVGRRETNVCISVVCVWLFVCSVPQRCPIFRWCVSF